MNTTEQLNLAQEAISHTLRAICNDPQKFYLMGGRFNGSFEKLATAHAACHGLDIESVFQNFQPHRENYERYCDEREANERLLTHCRENGITAD